MYYQVESYNEPVEILGNRQETSREMSDLQSGFLCGLLKKVSPEKVLEVGVAGGGTTAVIMSCLHMIGKDITQVSSVDISERWYRDENLPTGFEFEEVKEQLPNKDNHKFILGKLLPDVIYDIGGEIDFVILDTIHCLPGEILDFLCVFPFLKNNATIVIHDVILHLRPRNNAHDGKHESAMKQYATKILLDSVSGKKYLNIQGEFPTLNIAAFMVNEDTKENIANVFAALLMPWPWFPGWKMIYKYYSLYQKFYDDECMLLFERAIYANLVKCKEIETIDTQRNRIHDLCLEKKNIYIYGAGIRGHQLNNYLKVQEQVEIAGYIVSDEYAEEETVGLERTVYCLSNICNRLDDSTIVMLGTPALAVPFYMIRKQVAFELFTEEFFASMSS